MEYGASGVLPYGSFVGTKTSSKEPIMNMPEWCVRTRCPSYAELFPPSKIHQEILPWIDYQNSRTESEVESEKSKKETGNSGTRTHVLVEPGETNIPLANLLVTFNERC